MTKISELFAGFVACNDKPIGVEVYRGDVNFTVVRNAKRKPPAPTAEELAGAAAEQARWEARRARRQARRRAEVETEALLTPMKLQELRSSNPELADKCKRALNGSKTAKRNIARALLGLPPERKSWAQIKRKV